MTEQNTRQSTFATFIVMSSTFISRILGFVRTAVITALFGATGYADIINVTFAVPNNLRKLLAEGALSSAFIPVISEAIVEEDSEKSRSRTLVRHIIGFQLLIIVPICIFSVLLAKPLIAHVFTQFKDPAQIELSAGLFRFFINYVLFISISAVLIGVLNSHSRFFVPAVTPIIFSVCVIASLLLFYRWLGVYAMAVGVLAGGVGQILFQYPLFRKMGYTIVPSFRFMTNPDFRRIMKQWLPVLATSSVFTINQQVAFILASGLETGSASALSYALVFWQLPFGIFSASITTVLFPKMSRQVTQNDIPGLRQTVQYGIRFLFVLLVPSAVVMGGLGKEIISIAIQRGMFGENDTYVTSFVLTGYCFGLFSVGAFNFLQRYFYSSRQFALPFYVATAVSAVDITLSIILKETPLRVTGLAIANSVSFTLGFIALYMLAHRQLNGLQFSLIIKTVCKVLLASIPAILLIRFLQNHIGEYWRQGSTLTGFALLMAELICVALVYLSGYRLLKVEMTGYLFKRLKNRSKRKNDEQ